MQSKTVETPSEMWDDLEDTFAEPSEEDDKILEVGFGNGEEVSTLPDDMRQASLGRCITREVSFSVIEENSWWTTSLSHSVIALHLANEMGLDYDRLCFRRKASEDSSWDVSYQIESILNELPEPSDSYSVSVIDGKVRYNDGNSVTTSAVDMEEKGVKPEECPNCDADLIRVRGTLYCTNEASKCCPNHNIDLDELASTIEDNIFATDGSRCNFDHWMLAVFYKLNPKAFRPTDRKVIGNIFENRFKNVYNKIMNDSSAALQRSGTITIGSKIYLSGGSYTGTRKVFDLNALSRRFYEETRCYLAADDKSSTTWRRSTGSVDKEKISYYRDLSNLDMAKYSEHELVDDAEC